MTEFFRTVIRPPTFVLDAGVAVVWRVTAYGTPYTDQTLRHLTCGSATVPATWPSEVADGLIAAGEPAVTMDPFLDSLRNFCIHVEHQTEPHVWTATVPLARRLGLPVHRATYLELAARLDLPLATTDPTLIAAAPGAGVVHIVP